jgi:sec-independent protein translocase protein TatA
MGLGGISFGQLLIVFLIIAVLFGTKKLRTIGEDLGQAVHGFKKGLKEGSSTPPSISEQIESRPPVQIHTHIEDK